jgi:putative transposase
MKKTATPRKALAAGIAKVLKRLHFPLDVMLLCVRWYVAYSLSRRDLEEMMAERAIGVDHSTVHRWVIKLVPLFEKTFRKHNRRWARAGAWMKVCHEHKRKLVVLY